MCEASVRVYFADGKYSLLPIDALTTCADLEKKVAKTLKLRDSRPFALIESADFGDCEDRILQSDDRISEIIATWARSNLEIKACSNSHKGEILSYRLVYKVKYFLDHDLTDTNAIELWYIQSKKDMLDMKYLCTNQDYYVLAALQLQEEYGDYPSGDDMVVDGHVIRETNCNYLEGCLDSFIPSFWVPQKETGSSDKNASRDPNDCKNKSVVEKKILNMYKRLKGYSQLDARLTYLDFMLTFPVYGCHFFMVKSSNRKMPSQVLLAFTNSNLSKKL